MRPQNTDFMQSFRFHVTAQDAASVNPLQQNLGEIPDPGHGENKVSGFQSVTIPELSLEASEYREGTFKWTEKYSGIPTVSDVTLIRGVTQKDTCFYEMVMAGVNGGEYRYDVFIYHYHRTEAASALSGTPSGRVITCRESFATRAKINADLESTGGEVSLTEVDLAVESFDITYEAVAVDNGGKKLAGL